MPYANPQAEREYQKRYRADHLDAERDRSRERRACRTPEEWAAFLLYKRAWRARKNGPRPTREERFWAKVDKGAAAGCWVWRGAASHGYGRFKDDTGITGAHRFSYELHKGPIPEGMYVCHSCDNPPCVNPAHLFPGSGADNQTDRVRKGRHGWARITPDVAAVVRQAHGSGESLRSIASRFGITKSTASRICRGMTVAAREVAP